MFLDGFVWWLLISLVSSVRGENYTSAKEADNPRFRNARVWCRYGNDPERQSGTTCRVDGFTLLRL